MVASWISSSRRVQARCFVTIAVTTAVTGWARSSTKLLSLLLDTCRRAGHLSGATGRRCALRFGLEPG